MHVQVVLRIENVQEDLRRFPDTGYGPKGMTVPQDGKIGDRIELEEVRAGDQEEVSDHQVRGPGREEIGEAVKDVKSPLAGQRGDFVHLGCESFEPGARIQFVNGDRRVRFQKRPVLGETDVNDLLFVRKGPGHKRIDKTRIDFDVVYLPDHIVSDPEPVQEVIQAVHTGTCFSECLLGGHISFLLFKLQIRNNLEFSKFRCNKYTLCDLEGNSINH